MVIASRLGACLCALLLCLGPAHAGHGTGPLDDLAEIGRGELRWFGMEVYSARLLNGGERFEGLEATGPVALEITYRRNISRERLVQSTEREWRRLHRGLGLPERSRVEGWLNEVAAIWPDVEPGDRITARVEPGGPTHFYGNDGPLGQIDDPAFGPAFLGIWLHPDTRDSGLRSALMGEER